MRDILIQLASELVERLEKKTADADQVADAVIRLLAQRGQLSLVRELPEAIERVWKERYGAATISVQSAHPLTAALRKQIEALAPGAELRETVDTKLIGGMRLRIDDRIIDGSIAGHLDQLRTQWKAS
ncbi:F0F1 ATP synthase subunit delta [Candidatus Uhrbacteria bacterium]|nr:F0F1 ATP synthase subunit delta [Candidatus Uhrbacteria bacterium]